MLHGVVGQTESFLHRKNTGVQKLQKHLNISAHDIVQDDVFHAVFRIGGKVSVIFQGIFEHLAEAVRDGVDLMGYTPWGWIDVVSASTGEL